MTALIGLQIANKTPTTIVFSGGLGRESTILNRVTEPNPKEENR
jgi:hypothetical protein